MSGTRAEQGAGASAADIQIGRRIRLQRRRIGMSQKAMAYELGVSYQQIQKYELARNKLYATKLISAARVLQTSAGFLVGETDTPHPAADRNWLSTTDVGVCAVLEAIVRLKPDQLSTIASIISTMEQGPKVEAGHAL